MPKEWHKPTTEERFWSRVDKDGPICEALGTPCWVWLGCVETGNGRPRFAWNGKTGLAYRYSYELAYGEIPPGLQVDHRCHRVECVRPGHLRAATPKQNSLNRRAVNTNNKLGVRGVYARKGKFQAQVRIDGKLRHLGTFTTIDEAKEAVDNCQPVC